MLADDGHDFLSEVTRWNEGPPGRTLPDLQGTIGKIYINRLPIFDEQDPEENRGLYRWANRVHITTKKKTIERLILVKEGDPYNADLLSESERILRNTKYLTEAEIRPVNRCGDSVDVEVITHESWTLTPQFSISSSGGRDTSSIAISDTNILGTGQQITFAYKQGLDRDSHELHYREPNFRGSRVFIKGRLINSDDGSEELASVFRPFFALDTRRSWGATYHNIDRVDGQYDRGKRVSELRNRIDMQDVYYGFSQGVRQGSVSRYSFGFRNESHQYSSVEDETPRADFPNDIELAYPYFQYERVEDNFVKGFDLNQIYRTEDLHVGHRFMGRIGYSSYTDNFLVFGGEYSDTLLYKEKKLLQFRSDLDGRWNSEDSSVEDLLGHLELEYHRAQTDRRSLVTRLSGTFSKNLNASEQLYIGGDTGLRGFPSRYRSGDHTMTFAIEERIYTDYHLFQLARVGYAVFAEAGRVWNPHYGVSGGKMLKDVGFGMRLALSKASDSRIIHIDVAFPIDRPEDVDSVQFTVEMKQSL